MSALTTLQHLGQAFDAGWRDIDSAPKDGTWFLAYWPVHAREDQIRVTSYEHDANDGLGAFVDSDDWCDWKQPTHWQPLPPPPAADVSVGAVRGLLGEGR